MKKKIKKIKYTDEPMKMGKRVYDLFPSDDLFDRTEVVQVKVPLSKRSVDYLKSIAKKTQSSYQVMIRHIIDRYISLQSGNK